MKLVVGLGNPGKKYDATRHNVGFDVLRLLAERWQAGPMRAKHESLVAECRLASTRALLIWPQTYMNHSGVAARSAVAFYKAPLDDVLIVCDDFNLPLGKLRTKTRGSAGGQNGLKDVLQQLGDEGVPRLRLGIGPLPEGREVTAFVLGRFGRGERDAAEAMIGLAADAVECWANAGSTEAMNRFNG
ncbi:MAG: aminoacyl-tRNA hydrolase [Planctomycetota bacterium]